MQLMKAIKERRSIRQYLHKSINEKDLTQLLMAYNYAPSHCNTQASKILLIKSMRYKRFISHYFNGGHWASKAPIILLILIDSRIYCLNELSNAWLDAGLGIQNLLLASHELGLGACVLGWAKNNEVDVKVKQFFKLPDYYFIIAGIALGYPLKETRVVPRKPLKELMELI
jgi:nitroreductase